jgi:hypothetical protein
MGANRKQGWNLLVFLAGFTCLPAGIVYLGPIVTLIGLAFLIASAIGFYRIKPLEHGAPAEKLTVVLASSVPPTAERAVGTR